MSNNSRFFITGLIPAHAGKTPVTWHGWPTPSAHPRSRGENRELSVGDFMGAGSSPLTRGKLLSITRLMKSPGLIPAHAGKTFEGKKSFKKLPAHPRSRGENMSAVWVVIVRSGSSPLTRGKR